MKESRASRRAKLNENQKSMGISAATVGTLATLGLLGYCIYDIRTSPNGLIGSFYHNSALDKWLRDIFQSTIAQVFEPAVEKIMPDFPNSPIYAGLPPNTPCPPLLVVDLEKTLIGSVYDSRHGWRHVKRPGVDKFITTMSQYYEILILSENDMGMVMEILAAIDPEGRCHKQGAAALEQRGSTLLKRLDLMNRDPSRILVLDDNPESTQLCSRNALYVKPFTNVHDRSDSVLLDIMPFLQALVHEGKSDFRQVLDGLGTHDAEEAAIEYRMRVTQAKAQQLEKRNKGLGRLIRGDTAHQALDDGSVVSSILSPKDIVGGLIADNVTTATTNTDSDATRKLPPLPGQKETPKGPSVKKKGGLFSYLDEVDKAKEEEQMLKMQKFAEMQQAKSQAQQQQ
jgi:import inner membrane translocase subunit TIM50